jgi:hypothetical protein
MQQGHVDGMLSLDFFFSASAGAEFQNYRLDVQNRNGALLQDPVKANTFDPGGDATDTWMNTVGSLLGFNSLTSANYSFSVYRPVGIGSDSPPVSAIDWGVFDVFTGDTNHIDGVGNAPWHFARVLASPNAMGVARFTAFDTMSDGSGTLFEFSYGVPEPSTIALIDVGMLSAFSFRRRADQNNSQ